MDHGSDREDCLESEKSHSLGDEESLLHDFRSGMTKEARLSSYRGCHLATLYCVIFILFITLLVQRTSFSHHQDPSQGIYSPAQEAVEYKTIVFDENFVNKGPYMGQEIDGIPTDATDALWEDLFQFGISSISGEEAKGLPNSTAPIPNQSNRYVVELDVFHQLHCLNAIRKTFFPERYTFDDYFAADGTVNHTSTDARHFDHCIDSIRQSIMCHGDIATVYWRYNDLRRIPIPSLSITHTCRNFDVIKDWAKQHQLVDDEHKLKWAKGDKGDFVLSGPE